MGIENQDTLGIPHSYTIKPGDTLSKIAKDNGFKNWQELTKLQPQGFNPQRLKPGQEIILRKNLSPQNISQFARGAEEIQALRELEEPVSVDPLIELDSLMPGPIGKFGPNTSDTVAPTAGAKNEKPEGLSEKEDALWDICIYLGIDPSQFQDQQMRKKEDGSLAITTPGSRGDKMSAFLSGKIGSFRKGELTIGIDESLGKKLEELVKKYPQGKIGEKIQWIPEDISVIRDMSDILLGKVKGGIETSYDDRLAEFRRKYVKSNFFTFRALGLPEEIKSEAKLLLGQYAGSTDPEKIYQITIEKALSGGTMHSIVSSIMIGIGGEYEKYGEELRKQLNHYGLKVHRFFGD